MAPVNGKSSPCRSACLIRRSRSWHKLWLRTCFPPWCWISYCVSWTQDSWSWSLRESRHWLEGSSSIRLGCSWVSVSGTASSAYKCCSCTCQCCLDMIWDRCQFRHPHSYYTYIRLFWIDNVPLPNGLRGNCAIWGLHGPLLYLELCPLDKDTVKSG